MSRAVPVIGGARGWSGADGVYPHHVADIRSDLIPPVVICVGCGHATTDPIIAVDHLRDHEALNTNRGGRP